MYDAKKTVAEIEKFNKENKIEGELRDTLRKYKELYPKNKLCITGNRVIERGITFYPNTLATGFEGMQNNLRIQYAATDDTSRTISIRNPGANKFIQLVDTGKYAGSDSSTTPGFVDLGQQTIYNKTLADGTIIDCGTY